MTSVARFTVDEANPNRPNSPIGRSLLTMTWLAWVLTSEATEVSDMRPAKPRLRRATYAEKDGRRVRQPKSRLAARM